MAITAWSAKVRSKIDMLLGERLHPLAENEQQTNRGALAHQGTPNMLRMPIRRWKEPKVYSGSLSASSISTGAFSKRTRAPRDPRPGL